MTGEDFLKLWKNDKWLRQYIVDQAKRRSKRKELQEEFVQEAWLAISCAPYGCCTHDYCHVAYKAIYSSYWQNKKESLLMNAVKDVFMYGMPPDASFDALMGGGGIGRPLMSDESYEEYWDDYTSWYERRPTGDN